MLLVITLHKPLWYPHVLIRDWVVHPIINGEVKVGVPHLCAFVVVNVFIIGNLTVLDQVV